MAAPLKDPWARREAWRYQGPFTRFNRFRNALPGLGLGITAFVLFNVYEHFNPPASEEHH